MTRRRGLGALTLALTIMVAACGESSDRATRTSIGALERASATTPTSAAESSSKTGVKCDKDHPTRSFRPRGPLPPPGHMPPGTFMAEIASRGKLRAAVDENTLLLSFRNPRTGQFEGFEIDLVHELAKAIFGDARRVDLIPVTTDEKVRVAHEGRVVDLTVSAVSITCDRWKDVLFSTPYYQATTKVQVRSDERGRPIHADGTPLGPIRNRDDLVRALKGRRVCATTGSTSIPIIEKQLRAIPDKVSTRPECLMALQDGAVDAISTHDTFLLGFQRQDPNTVILAPALNEQPYGIAINQQHPEFLRFVNAVLQRLRAQTLAQLYAKNFLECEVCGELNAPPTMPALRAPEWLD